MTLTNAAIRGATPRAKPRKLYDAGGLYLEVSPTGGKWWRWKYRFGGKEKRISLGVYPDVSLKSARERRDTVRQQLAAGIDPGQARKAQKLAVTGGDTFEAIAREWHAKFSPGWVTRHRERTLRRFENDLFPWLGTRPVADITAPELLAVLRRIESRGAVDSAHRVMRNCGQIFRYAVSTGRAGRDPTGDIRGALPPSKEKHHATMIEPKRIGELLRAIDAYPGFFVTKCALRLAPLVFTRPGELRHAQWPELDLDEAEWRIPAEKMKMREPHIVPLSRQSVDILSELEPLTNRWSDVKPDAPNFVFPSARSSERSGHPLHFRVRLERWFPDSPSRKPISLGQPPRLAKVTLFRGFWSGRKSGVFGTRV